MNLETLQTLDRTGIAFDVETYLIVAGNLAPPLVCASIAALGEDGQIAGEILDKQRAAEAFALLLDDESRSIIGANLAFDLLVGAVTLVRLGVDPMPAIFAALMDRKRCYDIQIAEQLDAVAEGCLGKDPRTGGGLMSPETGRRAGYSLAVVTDLVLGRKDAKVNDEFRLRYGELDALPMSMWPLPALTYPVDDARNTAEDALAQAGLMPRAGVHRWGPMTSCEWCGLSAKDAYAGGQYAPCRAKRRSRNLHDLANQVGTAFAMHLGAARGLRVDQDYVDRIENDALEGRVQAEEPFIAAGLLKRNRDMTTSKDTSAIARAVALAYGADGHSRCETCDGKRKVVSPKAKPKKCPACRGLASSELATAQAIAWRAAAGPLGCPACRGAGTVPDPTALINCTECAATGLDLSTAPTLPKTDTGRVAAGRDVLNESGSEILRDFADHQEDAKKIEVYVPYLRRGRTPVAGHGETCPQREDQSEACSCPGPYRDVPLTLFPNVLLETGRTSYRGVVQLLPRAPGYYNSRDEWIPSLRECFAARDGWVYSSEDYEAGELITHAQSCIWITGESYLANAILQGKKIHNLLAASMIGMAYDDFQVIIGDPTHPRYLTAKNARQAAKPGNFGFPGGMGPVKMVLQQRKQGPDTPCEDGPTWIKDDDGRTVRGYKGLRFCILMRGARRCGIDMLTQWPPRGDRSQPIAPTCRACIECALELKTAWLKQWPENVEYFRYINDCCENGMLITREHLRLWPHLAPFFTPNTRLAPGEIMQHVSGRVRGGTDYTSAANGFFQGLLADAAKSALRRIARECYDSTVVVPERAHPNSTPSKYAGGPSPLLGHFPILFAHDEVILEHPEGEAAHHGAMRTSELMVEEFAWYCPDLAPACRAEPTLMSRWFKSATQMWRDGGKKSAGPNDRLVPWQPKRVAA